MISVAYTLKIRFIYKNIYLYIYLQAIYRSYIVFLKIKYRLYIGLVY